MARRYKKACFGGTFDIPIHSGHEALVTKAFMLSDFCSIGLTTDDYAQSFFKRGKSGKFPQPFEKRKKNLLDFLKSKNVPEKRFEIIPIDKFYSEQLLDEKDDTEAIIVSKETLPGARGINLLREDLGLKPLKIAVVENVMAQDGLKISSDRIRAGEITKDGKLVKEE